MDYALNEFHVIPFNNGGKVFAYLTADNEWKIPKADYSNFEFWQKTYPEGFRRFHSALNAYILKHFDATNHSFFQESEKMIVCGKSAVDYLIDYVIPTQLTRFNTWLNKSITPDSMLALFFGNFSMFPLEKEPVEWIFQNSELRVGILMCHVNITTPFNVLAIRGNLYPTVLKHGLALYAEAYKIAAEVVVNYFNQRTREKFDFCVSPEDFEKRVKSLTETYKKEAKNQPAPEAHTRTERNTFS